MRINIILFITFLFLQCQNNIKPAQPDDNSPSDSVRISEEDLHVKYSDSTAINAKAIEIISVDSITEVTNTGSEFATKCLTWKISNLDLHSVLNLSKVIDGSEVHDLYYDLPCRIRGEVLLSGEKYKFILNGGSFVYIYNQKDRFYLGCSDERCRPFFVVQGGNLQRDVLDH